MHGVAGVLKGTMGNFGYYHAIRGSVGDNLSAFSLDPKKVFLFVIKYIYACI